MKSLWEEEEKKEHVLKLSNLFPSRFLIGGKRNSRGVSKREQIFPSWGKKPPKLRLDDSLKGPCLQGGGPSTTDRYPSPSGRGGGTMEVWGGESKGEGTKRGGKTMFEHTKGRIFWGGIAGEKERRRGKPGSAPGKMCRVIIGKCLFLG